MSKFTESTIKDIQYMKDHNWEKYSKEELLNWIRHCFHYQEMLIGSIERKELIIESLESKIELMKICENCNNAVWEANWMYSKYHCEQDNCNNYSKWELKSS